ncbi:MAG TPA: integrase arm-type DNA-binding domain-containing protein [Acidisphaera sp.]|nr:integrase arm-type DNA-binding domain-containing protein [Acidisphaera sp.]
MRTVGKLRVHDIPRLPPGRHSDGGSLILEVKPTGSRSWTFNYECNGVRGAMGLGPFPAVSLAQARDRAADARRLLAQGVDPLAAKRQGVQAKAGVSRTFEAACSEYIGDRRAGWRPRTVSSVEGLCRLLCRQLGQVPVASLSVDDALRALRPLWPRIPVRAGKARRVAEAVLDHAVARGWRDRQAGNPFLWRSNLSAILPRPSQVRQPQHVRAIAWGEAPALWRDLAERGGIAPMALRFAMLTAARPSEIAEATWGEVDFDRRLWTIGGSRSKTRRTHRVPLTDPAIVLLRQLAAVRLNAHVFPSLTRKDRPISTASMLRILERSGVDSTAHGMRSAFRSWAADTGVSHEIAEAALAHRAAPVTRAYQRSDLLEQRRAVMERWGTFVTGSEIGSARRRS